MLKSAAEELNATYDVDVENLYLCFVVVVIFKKQGDALQKM